MAETYFDTRTGELLTDDMVIRQELEQSAPGEVVPLRELLLADEFPFKPGDFEKVDPKQFDKEKCINIGKIALSAINEGNKQATRPLTSTHNDRLAILGLSLTTSTIGKRFGVNETTDFTAFKEAVGSPLGYSRKQYSDWSFMDYVAHARKIERRIGGKPTNAHFQELFLAGKGPSRYRVQSEAGGIDRVVEYLGYPNIAEMDKDGCVDWGVRVRTANPDKPLSFHLISALSAADRGPSTFTVKKLCGSWKNFVFAVESRYAQIVAERSEKIADYRSMAMAGRLPAEFAPLADDDLLVAAAKYRVAAICLPGTTAAQILAVSGEPAHKFIAAIRKINPKQTPGDIELEAISEDVFDDIWPIPNDTLVVPDSEIAARRKHEAEKSNRLKKARREAARAS